MQVILRKDMEISHKMKRSTMLWSDFCLRKRSIIWETQGVGNCLYDTWPSQQNHLFPNQSEAMFHAIFCRFAKELALKWVRSSEQQYFWWILQNCMEIWARTLWRTLGRLPLTLSLQRSPWSVMGVAFGKSPCQPGLPLSRSQIWLLPRRGYDQQSTAKQAPRASRLKGTGAGWCLVE